MLERYSSNHPVVPQDRATGTDEVPATRLRDQHKAVTRQAILGAARELFTDRSYAHVSVKEIAARAGVSVQTLYATYGSKRGIARALVDLIPEEAGVYELVEEMARSEDPTHQLALLARVRRRIRERCSALVEIMRAAAHVEPEVATLWSEGLRQRAAGARRAIVRLDERGALRAGLDVERAAAIVAALCCDEVFDALVLQHGWSADAYEQWLASALAEQLLQEPG